MGRPSRAVSDEVRRLHDDALVVDLHNDLLIKITHLGADVRKRHRPACYWNPLRLDLDLPRIREGGLDALVFMLYGAYRFDPGHRRFWKKTLAVRRLLGECAGQIELVTRASGLDRARGAGQTAMLLGVEGAEALAEAPERLLELHALGVRSMGPLWNRSNAFGVSARDEDNPAGLTARGRELVRECNRLGLMVDVSHAGPRTIWDMIEESAAPVYCSHTAAKSVTPHWRNLDDAILAAIGQKGGVIGVIFCPFFLGGPLASIEELCDHIEHVAKVAGPQAVALGSDFDGMIPLVRGMRDVRDLPRITEALHRRGWREPELRGVLGENFRRYFERVCGT